MNRRLGWFLGGGLLVALLLAGVVSNVASSSPDGLDATTLQGCTTDAEGNITGGECIARQQRDHEIADGPLADYGVRGLDNRYLSTGVSGVIGVLLTFAIGGGVFWLLRRRGSGSDATGTASGRPAGDDTAGTASGPPAGADTASTASGPSVGGGTA